MGLEMKYGVCIECMTFNQAGYVKDTLDGFCKQKTNFPFICIIMDDASTDGEQNVISRYMKEHFCLEDSEIVKEEKTDDYEMYFAQHKENKNCYFAFYQLKYNHFSQDKRKEPYLVPWRDSSKYIAMCEGDDYWTFPAKLQVQFDYLESHPDVALSCHRYTILDVASGATEVGKNPYFNSKKHVHETEFEFDKNYFLSVWITKTLTNMYRRSAFKDDYYEGFKYARDVHFNYFALTKGKGVCHAFNGGIYRKNVNTSIFGNLNLTDQAEKNCKVFEELWEKTQDATVKNKLDALNVQYCMNRLRPVEGCYYWALKMVRRVHILINFMKRGFSFEVPTLSLK